MPSRRNQPAPSRDLRTSSAEPGDRALRPISTLPGIGPARARALERVGIARVRDLLFLMPRRLLTASAFVPIATARGSIGEEVGVAGTVQRVTLSRFRKRSTLRVTIADETGSIVAVYFNQPWLRTRFVVGERIEVAGRVVESKGPTLIAPKLGSPGRPLAEPGSAVPIYPKVEGVGQELLSTLCRAVAREHAGALVDPLPADVRAGLALPPLSVAALEIHAPTSADAFAAARRRIALEQLLRFQAGLQARRRERGAGHALSVAIDDATDAEIVARFPFVPTTGQRAVIADLRADLSRSVPMRRLLQGDVGAGKTALGLYAAVAVARAGGQTAFLAPTELLAEQHYDGLRRMLTRAGLHAALLTGSLAAGERRQVIAQIESGMADIVFGTHALFSADVRYRRLALAVIDEQQRFGVAQRARILDKGRDVHVLLMTATPIPRTLALTLYGDLDTSLLKDRPPGRGAVRTRWVRGHDRRRVPAFLRERLEQGDQVYWVVPRIGSGEDEAEQALAEGQSSAELAYERLSRSELAVYGVELVHGRLLASERAARLERFRRGEVRVLVATTVVEVGVDVPEATVMVIENAERLGLAQLHQLRGRIGRGPRESWCLLFGTTIGSDRFLALEKTTDGFEIAEEDLRRRGMGDLAGVRQAGENMEGLAQYAEDVELLLAARDLVQSRAEIFEAYSDPSGIAVVP